MKKYVALALALILALASVAALAEEDKDTQTITLSLTVPTIATEYEWNIPANLTLSVPDAKADFGQDEKNTFKVTVTKLSHLKKDMQLIIAPVTEDCSLSLTSAGEVYTISYGVYKVTVDDQNGTQWTHVAFSPLCFTEPGEHTVGIQLSDLNKLIEEMSIPGGEYSGELTFKAELKSIEAS